jgi:hypothetical protein
MTLRYGLIVSLALGAVIAAPALAQADVLLPPYDGSQPPAKIATDSAALAALHHGGVARVSSLGQVGDYWEGNGFVKGKPVIAYVFSDGAVKIQPASPGERVRVQSAELPE